MTEVEAIQRVLASGMAACTDAVASAPDDRATACDGWTVRDLVRHLEVVAGSNVLWTSAALGGRVRRALSEPDQDAFNHEMLDRLPRRSTAAHLERFVELADDHVRLVRATAAMPMTELGDGRVLTAAEHAGLVALEWHVHAWDLARSNGDSHLPEADDVAVLIDVWATADPAAAAELDLPTWTGLLRALGRQP